MSVVILSVRTQYSRKLKFHNSHWYYCYFRQRGFEISLQSFDCWLGWWAHVTYTATNRRKICFFFIHLIITYFSYLIVDWQSTKIYFLICIMFSYLVHLESPFTRLDVFIRLQKNTTIQHFFTDDTFSNFGLIYVYDNTT